MTDTMTAAANRQALPDGDQPDPRLAGISAAALKREIRRRNRAKPTRDVRANPVTIGQPGAAGNMAGKHKENAEFLGVLAQLIAAAGKRIGAKDLGLLREFEDTVDTARRTAVAGAAWEMVRAGVSWAEIGEALGMTKSAAFERFEPYRPADMPKNPRPGTRPAGDTKGES